MLFNGFDYECRKITFRQMYGDTNRQEKNFIEGGETNVSINVNINFDSIIDRIADAIKPKEPELFMPIRF